MVASDHPLAVRVRAALPAPRVREVRMFGGLAFMLDERMLACVDRGDGLLVRVSPARDAALALRPDAGRMRMGAKELGAGWILVSPEGVASDEGLAFWLDQALDSHGESAVTG